ncbi:MAG: zeta toxin family protein, partial [Alphaproteobacteria bacterium]|nr:zeta toxin family protein [Alphaproteobacteria bacterium]
LSKCFFENSSYEIMGDIDNPKSILIGGTGAGKTALIERFYQKNENNCVRLSLDEVSLNYISNSNILM